MTFKELGLSSDIAKAVSEKGYENPTDIQEQAIPRILEGHDILAQSQTGTGKTAAFGLPLISLIDRVDRKYTQGLVLCPTRELCIQVADEMRSFAKYKDELRIVSVYGGESIDRQIRDIKRGADIVVATPGRLMDHIRRRTLRLNHCNHIVLDEADEMLNMGFVDDIREIFTYLPEQRQMVFFSATMPKEIVKLSDDFLNEPEHIRLSNNNLTVSRIKQVYYTVDHAKKINLVTQLLQIHDVKGTMIFCNTKKMVDELATELNKAGFPALGLHGDMKQEMRSMVMGRFKRGLVKVLIATDVAARGIDVDSMDVVINYDVPQELEYYIHRIGRTGRAGKEGLAITLVNRRQRYAIKQIERLANSEIEELPLPSKEQLNDVLIKKLADDIRKWSNVEPGKLFNIACEGLRNEEFTQEDFILAFINKAIAENNLEAMETDAPERKTKNPNVYGRLSISLGSRQGIKAAHIVSAVAKASGIRGKEIGKIEVGDIMTLVDVPQEHLHAAHKAVGKTTIKGQAVNVEIVEENIVQKPRKRSERNRDSRDDRSRRDRDNRRGGDRSRRGRKGNERVSRDQEARRSSRRRQSK